MKYKLEVALVKHYMVFVTMHLGHAHNLLVEMCELTHVFGEYDGAWFWLGSHDKALLVF